MDSIEYIISTQLVSLIIGTQKLRTLCEESTNEQHSYFIGELESILSKLLALQEQADGLLE